MIDINSINITEELLLSISRIETFKGGWPYISKGKDSLLTILRAQAKIASTGSSNRIEGSLLKDYEIERILGGMSSPLFRTRDVIEARGYAEVLSEIVYDYEIIELSEATIQRFHSTLIADEKKTGYRETDKPEQNLLTDEPTIDNASAKDAPAMLQRLIVKTNAQIRNGSYHPIIIAGAFMENFLSINPFGEGNGRLARLITMLILMKSGYGFVSCYPFETIIEETRKSYLTALKKSQQDDSNAWLMYFTKVFEKLSLRLEARVSKESTAPIDNRYTNLSPIEQDIVKCISNANSLYTSDLISMLPEYKVPTIKKALRTLVEKKEIIMLGIGRGTYYKDARKAL